MMEDNVIPLHDSALHMAHANAFSALKGAGMALPGQSLRLRYDGFASDEGPRIFAVVPLEDLVSLTEKIDLSRISGSGLPGEGVFFLHAADGPALYLDTDQEEGLYLSILDAAHDSGLKVFEAQGDLMRLCHVPRAFGSVLGDVTPPRRPAYEVNDFAHIPIDVAMEMLSIPPSKDLGHDPSLPQP